MDLQLAVKMKVEVKLQVIIMKKTLICSSVVSLVISCTAMGSNVKQARLWEPVEWIFQNPSSSGNPFDLEVLTTFTHVRSGQIIRTELFYVGGDTWKLRFTGNKLRNGGASGGTVREINSIWWPDFSTPQCSALLRSK